MSSLLLFRRCSRLFVLGFVLTATAWGADQPPATPEANPSPAKSERPKSAPAFDPYAIPTGELPELLEYIAKADKWYPKITQAERKNPELLQKHMDDSVATRKPILEAIAKALTMQPSEAQRVTLLKTKFNVLKVMAMYGDPQAAQTTVELARTLLQDADESLRRDASLLVLDEDLNNVPTLPREAREKIIARLLAVLADPITADNAAKTAYSQAMNYEARGHYAESRLLYEMLQKEADQIQEERYREMIKKRSQSCLTRLNMIGKPAPVLKGKLVDGTDFELASLKGKVVLVEFWATWCKPCVAEVPNILKNYHQFHDRGFEVVGVSIDDDKEALEKFLQEKAIPWRTMFNPDEELRSYNNPLATAFSINGVPATYLIDREGNVVAVSVRGNRIAEQIEKLLSK